MNATVAPSAGPPRRRRALKWAAGIALLLIVLLAAFLWLPEPASPAPQFAWMPAGSIRFPKSISTATIIKYKLLGWLGPLGRPFARYRPDVSVETQLSLRTGPPIEIDRILGAPIATNSEGSRAWILTTSELSEMRRSRESVSDYSKETTRMIVSAADGTTTMCVAGNLILGLTPNLARRAVRLQFSVSAGPLAGLNALTQTNSALSWEATIPNHNAVLVATGSPGAGSNYRLLVVPTRIDARGKPIP